MTKNKAEDGRRIADDSLIEVWGLDRLVQSIWNVEEGHPQTPLERGLAKALHIVTNIIFTVVAGTVSVFTLFYLARSWSLPGGPFSFFMVFAIWPILWVGLLVMKRAARLQLFTIIGAIAVATAYVGNIKTLGLTALTWELEPLTYWGALRDFIKAVFLHLHAPH